MEGVYIKEDVTHAWQETMHNAAIFKSTRCVFSLARLTSRMVLRINESDEEEVLTIF